MRSRSAVIPTAAASFSLAPGFWALAAQWRDRGNMYAFAKNLIRATQNLAVSLLQFTAL
jgi:hypothetical protein